MKRFISTILILVLFIPFIVLADVTSYDKFDIKISFEEGKKVSEMEYSIFASTNEDEELIDKTNELTSDIVYFKVLEDESHEEVSGEYIFKNDESYGFNLKITKPENIALNVDKSSILINSSEQDDLVFESNDEGISIEYYPEIKKTEEPVEVIEEPVVDEGSSIANDIIKKDDTCVFGLSLCCNSFRGISYCVLGIIGIVLLILIISLIHLISDRAEERKYKNF